ncbi:MAG: thiol reductant ABC exporter subunit CydC [Pseudomonadales bacterium]
MKPAMSSLELCCKLLQLCRPHWLWLTLGILLALLTALANIALMAVSGWFITAMASAGLAGVHMNYFTPAGTIRFLAITRTAGRYAERLVTHNATLLMLTELRSWFYQRIEPLAPAALQRYRSAELLSRLKEDIAELDNFYLRLLVPGAVALVAVPCVYLALFYYLPPLAHLVLMALIVIALPLPYWAYRRAKPLGAQLPAQQAALNSALLEGLQGARELAIYAAVERQQAIVMQHSETLAQTQSSLNTLGANSQAIAATVVQFTLLSGLILLGQSLHENLIDLRQLPMLLLLSLAAFDLVLPLPQALLQLSAVLAAARRVFELTEQQPVRVEPVNPVQQAVLPMRVEELHFSYPSAAHIPVLKGLSFELSAGEKVALKGPSGCGKSTFMQLLQGFYSAPRGSVLLNGCDIAQYSADSLRAQLSLVSQSGYLFSATIRDNLLLANPEATEKDLLEACERAAAREFIEQLPEGLDTWIGEAGRGLSGGQARRIQIAQALLKDAPVLLLDEPTEGLDSINEKQVIQGLWQLMRERSVILISHNPKLLKYVNRVIELE